MENWALALSDRCYRTMLSLYPVEFRVRFRREMAQVFLDSCRDEIRGGHFAALFFLWFRALVDLALSISRERGRVLVNVRHLPIHVGGLVDSMVILTIIVFHLLAAGAGLAFSMPRSYSTTSGFFLLSAGMGAALGGFGVICSTVLSHFRRAHYRLIPL